MMSGEELKEICKRLNWSYSRLARELAVTPKSVSRWASGNFRISKPTETAIRVIFERELKGKNKGDLSI
jgi:transcriptional regulator with XRE-family HTH domain